MKEIKTKESERYKNTFQTNFNNLCTLYMDYFEEFRGLV